jgi:glutathione synthase/RimK-type ligase-like ATP-grasp enzyme
MRRFKLNGDFRSNFSLGSQVTIYNQTKEEEDMVIKVAKEMGCGYCGVDYTWDKNSQTFKIIEVNGSPGSVGIEQVNGSVVIRSLFNYCLKLLNVEL